MNEFNMYHFHIYFEDTQLLKAEELVAKIKDLNLVDVGRVREEPVGPHPVGSCQITVTKENLNFMLSWFLQNREDLDVFVHPLSGNDLQDHTEYTFWLGKPYALNLDIFR